MDKRPMLIITITYIIGILLGLYLEINMVLFILITMVLFIILNIIFRKKTNKIYEKILRKLCSKFTIEINSNKIKNLQRLFIICCLIIIISIIIINKKENKFNNLYNAINGENYYVGIVISVEKESMYYNNYIIKIKNINNGKLNIKNDFENTNILLKVKKSKDFNQIELEYGDLIYGVGNFEKPSIRRNYKGYDYSQYLKSENIYMICTSNMNDIKLIKKNSLFVTNMWINKLRNKLKNNLIELLPNETASVAIALLLGDTSLIDNEQKDVFSNASLSHILAISGMHVTYVIMGCSFILKNFDKRKSKFLLIGILIFFTQLTGGAPSVVRAVIMSSIMIISKLVYRKSDTLNNIAVSCLLILIINPYYILNLGFQLSFLGTLGIVLFNSKIISHLKQKENVKECKPYLKTLNKLLEKIKSIIIISISANTLIFPILIYSFNSISFIFLISNILVTPILGVMSLTGYFTMVLSLFSVEISKIFSIILNLYINIFKKIAEFNSSLTFARFITITPSYITIIAYYLIIFYVFYFYKKKHNKIILKLLSFSMIIVIMFNVLNKYNSSLKLHFIDVGQGDSTLIITSGNKKILIDGGGSETGNYDVGKNVLVPYLLDRKIKTIDFIIFSHFDTDHCAGLFTVMKELNVKNAIISTQGNMSENYKYFLELAKRKNINVICVQAGNRLQIDKFTYIDILWPNKNLIQENILNNNSIVCKLNYAATSILFTGDIEQIAEEEILKIYNKKILKSTILKVAHHGSKSSSIQDFIIQVQPKIALIGVGEKNNFGHPNEKVLERLQQCNSIIYRTDKNGEISIKVKKNGKIYINTEI